ncbi:MAG: hypothetical protein KAR06_02780 [Deltaproteobacteria bacterium]|nr:hypothetical protein [Deltaproteobacteria bacterium]
MYAYKFSSTAKEEKPESEITALLEKTLRKDKLTREEKDRVANILYGIFSGHSSAYRLLGWVWYMDGVLPRILVRYRHEQYFWPYRAPDKTSLRKVLDSVREMVYA